MPCKVSTPCTLGQGDCDEHSDCAGDLICGADNCGQELYFEADCCTKKTPVEIPEGTQKVTKNILKVSFVFIHIDIIPVMTCHFTDENSFFL